MAASIRPTSMILHTDPRKKWTKHDFLLLEALQIMEQERCGQCGLPVWMCHDETGGVQFAIEEDECIVKRDLDVRNEKDSDAKKKNHGIALRPRPFFVDGATWVGARDAYYKAQQERAQQLEELES